MINFVTLKSLKFQSFSAFITLPSPTWSKIKRCPGCRVQCDQTFFSEPATQNPKNPEIRPFTTYGQIENRPHLGLKSAIYLINSPNFAGHQIPKSATVAEFGHVWSHCPRSKKVFCCFEIYK